MTGLVFATSHLTIMRDYLLSRSVAPGRRLKQFAVEIGQRPLTAQEQTEFFRRCQDACEDTNFGLHAAEGAQIEQIGMLGLLMRSSENVASACAAFARFQASLGATQSRLTFDPKNITCTIALDDWTVLPRQLAEFLLARTAILARMLSPGIPIVEVRMMHPCPRQLREHRRIFETELKFGAPETAIVFSMEAMQRPMARPDTTVTTVLQQYVEKTIIPHEQPVADLPAAVRAAIRAGFSAEGSSASDVARNLQLGERTMRRRLQALGKSFNVLRDEVRCELAIQWLAEREATGSEIGHALGYAEPASFYRAFRRWTGRSITESRLRLTGV